jgi:SnoaL-like domain
MTATHDAASDPVADELAVRNLIARLSLNADMGTIDEYLASFTDDAVWNLPGNPSHGIEAIKSGLIARRESGAVGPGTHGRHMVSSIDVVVLGDRATARSYFQFVTNTDSKPTLALVGAYADEFVRTSNGWKLQRRDITFG